MALDYSIFTIKDLRGGINNTDSPTLLPENQVVDARNVDFRDGALGAKRNGTAGIDITGAPFNSPVVFIHRHTPTNQIANDELWAIDENGNIGRRIGGSWSSVTTKTNDFVVVSSANFNINAVSLHGKLFIAAKGSQDRLLLWDGTTLRWAGIAQPPDPTVANTGSGSYTGTRYFRIRYTAQDATGITLRRSEFTNVVSLSPSGSGSGALITKPSGTEASTSVSAEGQTHWEVEASTDNILFYRIATVAIGTSTYTDTTVYATGYRSGILSEQVGEYIPPKSARHVAVDEDRLVLAGNHFTNALDSYTWWTPVSTDDGVGNDERIPTATSQFINFDGLDGGRVTALVAGVVGNVYAFKQSRVYKMQRTGILTAAYDPIAESYSRGSVLRGACSGVDESGVPCAYFLDPSVGLCRAGKRGVETLGNPIRSTWSGRNPDAIIGPRIAYYPDLYQVWFTLPITNAEPIMTAVGDQILTASSDTIYISQTTPDRLVDYETKYNSFMFHDGVPGTTQAIALAYNDSNVLKPVIGTKSTTIAGGGSSYLHFADSGTTDSGTNFQAYIKTKPYMLGNLWSKFGLKAAALLARAASGTTLAIDMIRNFGVETLQKTISLTPAASESHVIKGIDNASMSELNTVQIKLGDSSASAQVWSLDQLVFKISAEDQTAG